MAALEETPTSEPSDPAAFVKEAYARYGAAVKRLAHHIVGDASEAENITGDVFEALVRKRQTIRIGTPKAIWAWLETTTKWMARDHLRRQQRVAVMDNQALTHLHDALQDLAGGQETRITLPNDDLKQKLAKLPHHMRRVVELHHFDGLTFEEIATKLGYAHADTARKVHTRAIQALRRWLTRPPSDYREHIA